MTTEILSPTEQEVELDLDALIRELDAGIDRLPEDALRTCQRHRDLVTPRLIEVLQEAIHLGRQGTIRAGNAHFFALFLLAEFEAKQALPVILELYSLRDPILDGLLGSAVTETTRRVLAVLAHDQPDLIEAMILAPALDEYVRWEAAATLCQLVRDEHMPRVEAIERLTRQIKLAAEEDDSWAVTISVCELGELNPLEVQDEIKALFEKQLVDESVIDWSSFEEYLLKPDQPGSCPQFRHWKPSAIADTVEELKGWYCFSEEARRPRPAPRSLPDRLVTSLLSDFEPPDSAERVDTDFRPLRIEAPRVGRNDPCPCGSGKKFKKCCLRAGDEL